MYAGDVQTSKGDVQTCARDVGTGGQLQTPPYQNVSFLVKTRPGRPGISSIGGDPNQLI